jgi:hypothetical protein
MIMKGQDIIVHRKANWWGVAWHKAMHSVQLELPMSLFVSHVLNLTTH